MAQFFSMDLNFLVSKSVVFRPVFLFLLYLHNIAVCLSSFKNLGLDYQAEI